MQKLKARGLIVRPEWAPKALQEIKSPLRTWKNLFLYTDLSRWSYWADTLLLDPYIIQFSSAEDAANQLTILGKSWSSYLWCEERLGAKIEQELEKRKALSPSKAQDFFKAKPENPPGLWTVLDQTSLLASAICSNPFAQGLLQLKENKKDPPSSAYLKLQEALLRLNKRPDSKSRCLEAGAAPGGWTWVLQQCGAQVEAWDRSELDEKLMQDPKISFCKGNAFKLNPENHDAPDWILSDLICYPPKLWQWIEPWLSSGKVQYYILTIKMQGEPDWDTMKRFAEVPNSLLYHGAYNKNELTWIHSTVEKLQGPGLDWQELR